MGGKNRGELYISSYLEWVEKGSVHGIEIKREGLVVRFMSWMPFDVVMW